MAIKALNITFAYDKTPVLNDVDFETSRGFVSIIGPNGSGKTTLVKILSGLIDEKIEGSVAFYGETIEKLSVKDRAKLFAIVSQKQYFPFPFTCMEMVALGRYPHKKDLGKLGQDDLSMIVKAMQNTQTLAFKDKMITDISGGEQQRVVLASALCQDTKILFLDEAFSALDISHKAKSIKLLKKLTDAGKLIVVSVMHDLNIAYKYSDTVYILKEGKVVSAGAPADVMTKDRISDVFDVDVDLVEGKGFYIDV
jgi:iron complex transport system ATP-binding protein